ncbi:MAG: U32 family peptidase [Lachnospiraceae bacterium]|nr:U32 family peptidase [Lachnospiraceae bacterium]
MTGKKPELLAPAANLECLRLAVNYGADAVYLGGDVLSLRAKADNFSFAEMAEGIAYAHAHGASVYVTANVFAHNADIREAEGYFLTLKEIGPDGILISDPGMLRLHNRLCPEIPLHISTQANNTNYETVLFYRELGAKRVVLARELSLSEIREIRDRIPEDMELEAFVHGAMCISYSGRCLVSSFLTGRDSNRGECTHPCRWSYAVAEEKREGEYFPLEETEKGTYLFHSKDLCMISHVPELMQAGIDSFKIEGRMKTALYTATVTRAYRKAIDMCLSSREEYEAYLPWLEEEIRRTINRGFTTGFFLGKPDEKDLSFRDSDVRKGAVYLGTVLGIASDGSAMITQKNKLSVGEEIEIMKPDGRNIRARILRLRGETGLDMESAPRPKETLYLTLSEPADGFDVLRRV